MRLDKPPKSLWQEIDDYFEGVWQEPHSHSVVLNLVALVFLFFLWFGLVMYTVIGLGDIIYRGELYYMGQEAQAHIIATNPSKAHWTKYIVDYTLVRIDPSTGEQVKQLRYGQEEMWFFAAIYYKQGNQTGVRFLAEELEKGGMGQPPMQVGHPTNIIATWYWGLAFGIWLLLRSVKLHTLSLWLLLCRWVWRQVRWAWSGGR